MTDSDGANELIEEVDDRPGIDAADRRQAFDFFVRLPGGLGSGLDLAIAMEASRKLCGELSRHARHGDSGLMIR